MARRRRPADHHGILRIDKPSGISSHDVVARVRRTFGQRQVGHTGTLDPLATGLMILTLGQGTRLGRYLEATHKAYDGTVTLGRSTTTYDREGDTVQTAEVPALTLADVQAAAQSLVGGLVQEVPAYSAVKVDGERLYAKARRNEAVDLPKREVQIHELEVVDFDGTEIKVRTQVSKGTYIRTLAVQLGAALSLPAYLSSLRRTEVGPFRVEDASRLDDEDLGPGKLIPPAQAIDFMPAVILEPDAAARVPFGQAPGAGQVRASAPFAAGDDVRVMTQDGQLLAVGVAKLSAEELPKHPTREPALSFSCVLVGR